MRVVVLAELLAQLRVLPPLVLHEQPRRVQRREEAADHDHEQHGHDDLFREPAGLGERDDARDDEEEELVDEEPDLELVDDGEMRALLA